MTNAQSATCHRSLFSTLALSALCLLSSLPLLSQHTSLTQEAAYSQVIDGPYVQWDGEEASIYRKNGEAWEKTSTRHSLLLDLPGITEEPLVLNASGPRPGITEMPEPERFLAISDIHGQYEKFRAILEAHHVIDESGRWTFGSSHLIIVGDVADRGNGVTQSYWLIRSLEQQALLSGGSVQMLLGNHEAMLLSGNFDYVHKIYKQKADNLPSLKDRYSAQDEIGRWLRKRSAVLKAGRFIFVHGGLSPKFKKAGMTLEQCNRKLQNLKEWKMNDDCPLLGEDGLLEYRGFIPKQEDRLEAGEMERAKKKDQAISEDKLEKIKQTFGFEHCIVGHTTLKKIETFFEGKVVGIDAGIKDKSAGEVLIWENHCLYRGLADGQRQVVKFQ